MEANSTNAEAEGTRSDNVYKKTVAISFETSLSVKGVSIDEEILYNLTEYTSYENATKETDIGPQVVHIYEIRNGGPSTIEEAEVYFLVPYESISGDPLVYLLNQPETTKNVQCEPTSFVNVKNLHLDQALVSKSFLVSQGAIEKSNLQTAGGRYSSTSSSASFSSSSTSTGQSSGKVYTDEERKNFDAEENRESSGDASYLHTQRAKAAAAEAHVAGHDGTHAAQYEYSSAWNSSSENGGPSVTYSASRNRSSVRGNDGRVQVSEYSTESYGGRSSGSSSDSYNANQQQYNRGAAQRQLYENSRGNADAHDEQAVYRSGFGSSSGSRAGFRTIDDIPTEENISQDISGLQSRTQSVSSGRQQSGTAQSSHSGTGRRRMMSQQDGEAPRPDLIQGVTPLEKIAQGGHGFQAGTLDLGTLGRDNVDEEIRRHGNAAHSAVTRGGSGSRQQSSSSSGGYQQSSSNGYNSGSQYSNQGHIQGGASQHGSAGFSSQHSSLGGSRATTTNDDDWEDEEEVQVEDGEYYDGEQGDNDQQQQSHHQQFSSQSRSGGQSGGQSSSHSSGFSSGIRSNQNSAPVDSRFRYYDRMRRDAPDFGELELKNRLHCNSSRCAVIRCTTGPLVKEANAWIALRMRLVAQTINIVRIFQAYLIFFRYIPCTEIVSTRCSTAGAWHPSEHFDNGRVTCIQTAIHRLAIWETIEGTRDQNLGRPHTGT